MVTSQYTPEQVAFDLRHREEGPPIADVCRKRWASVSRSFIVSYPGVAHLASRPLPH